MTTQLIHNYDNFSYNSEFIPNYNIFNINNNRFIGIGTNTPKHELSIKSNISITGNLIITNNLVFDTPTTYNNNFIHILYQL